MWAVHWPVGGVGEDGFWFVWGSRWNVGDCVIGFYNETGSHIPRGRRPSREAVARGVQKCYGGFAHGVRPHGNPHVNPRKVERREKEAVNSGRSYRRIGNKEPDLPDPWGSGDA